MHIIWSIFYVFSPRVCVAGLNVLEEAKGLDPTWFTLDVGPPDILTKPTLLVFIVCLLEWVLLVDSFLSLC